MKLGNTVDSIRNKNTYKDYKEELMALGFPFERQIGNFPQIRIALLAYKNFHGDLLVPHDYITDERYPEEVRGMKLGNVVNDIRCARSYEDHKEELLAMGFDFNKQKGDVSVLMEALLAYKHIFGNWNIPRSFMILQDDKRFPESVRRNEKYNLGRILQKIRCLDNYTRLRKEFLEMGIEFTFQPVILRCSKKRC